MLVSFQLKAYFGNTCSSATTQSIIEWKTGVLVAHIFRGLNEQSRRQSVLIKTNASGDLYIDFCHFLPPRSTTDCAIPAYVYRVYQKFAYIYIHIYIYITSCLSYTWILRLFYFNFLGWRYSHIYMFKSQCGWWFFISWISKISIKLMHIDWQHSISKLIYHRHMRN